MSPEAQPKQISNVPSRAKNRTCLAGRVAQRIGMWGCIDFLMEVRWMALNRLAMGDPNHGVTSQNGAGWQRTTAVTGKVVIQKRSSEKKKGPSEQWVTGKVTTASGDWKSCWERRKRLLEDGQSRKVHQGQ